MIVELAVADLLYSNCWREQHAHNTKWRKTFDQWMQNHPIQQKTLGFRLLPPPAVLLNPANLPQRTSFDRVRMPFSRISAAAAKVLQLLQIPPSRCVCLPQWTFTTQDF
jgi:hypothetical protein